MNQAQETIMTQEEWRAAAAQAETRQHPPGWSYRNDTRRMAQTLEAYHAELESIAASLERLGIVKADLSLRH